eukprot:scaffold655473_cov39-Prasinocladus_malaysianus.AAC.1
MVAVSLTDETNIFLTKIRSSMHAQIFSVGAGGLLAFLEGTGPEWRRLKGQRKKKQAASITSR